jgi:hypothetical protein
MFGWLRRRSSAGLAYQPPPLSANASVMEVGQPLPDVPKLLNRHGNDLSGYWTLPSTTEPASSPSSLTTVISLSTIATVELAEAWHTPQQALAPWDA